MYDGMMTAQFTLAEVALHCDSASCWIVHADKVYDVTDFLNKHPGGEEIILENAGTDATGPYESKGHTNYAHSLLAPYCIGQLVQRDRRHKSDSEKRTDG